MEQTVAAGASTAKRPTFLTVLCILTFVGTAVAVISGVMGYFASASAAAMMEGLGGMEGMETMPGMAEAMAAVKYAGVTLGLTIVGALLCLVGALMMWKLKKTGFYIYVAGQIIPLVASAVLLGGSAFGGMALFMGAIFPIAFIIMYGLNLKHMN